MTDHPRPDGKRKPGRPRLNRERNPLLMLHIGLPPEEYDAVAKIAVRQGISVTAAARQILKAVARKQSSGEIQEAGCE